MHYTSKQEPVFDLVKSMSKAEKRNFKLYATRQSGNQDAKFIALFDVIDSLDEYDETKILKKCPVTKAQLPNMKAHLYKQLLISIRLLDVNHNTGMQVREQIDFARILYDKGHYRQSLRMLDKAKEIAEANEHKTIGLQIIEFRKMIESLQTTRARMGNVEAITKEADALSEEISGINELSNISILLYGLYLKLGYVRSEKDLKLVINYFGPRLEKYAKKKLSFKEKVYYYQSMAMYRYIQHDFLDCNRYTLRWMNVFDVNPHMKKVMYDNYLTGYSRLLDGLFFLNNYRRYMNAFRKFEREHESVSGVSENAEMLYGMVYWFSRLNKHFLEGSFKEGLGLVKDVEKYIRKYENYIDVHHTMLFYYKIGCMYFGDGQFKKSIEYLQKVISTRDSQVRRDLQCYARILNLIASYEAGIDYNLDYQIKAVYSFLVKMNDMHEVQREMIAFIKKLNSIYVADFKAELTLLYERLLPYTSHPYERRTFFYLDIISWLESKIKGGLVADVIQARFRESQTKESRRNLSVNP